MIFTESLCLNDTYILTGFSPAYFVTSFSHFIKFILFLTYYERIINSHDVYYVNLIWESTL